MGPFNANLKNYELKIHRGAICHDNEELSKIWTETDLSFQSWHEEFDEVWPEDLKVSKNVHFNGFLLSKAYIFWTKKEQRSYLSWNWRGMQNLERNRLVISKLAYGIWQLLTWALESLKHFHFNGFLLSKVCVVWTKSVQMNYLSWNWRGMQNLGSNRLVISKLA